MGARHNSRYARRGRSWLAAAALLATGSLAACGGDSTDSLSDRMSTSLPGPVPTTTTGSPSPDGPRSATGDLETSGGSYRVELSVQGTGTRGRAASCAPAQAPGSTALQVTVTVVNRSADQPAPFPPLRVEMINGGVPAEVPVQDPSGTCTFTPKGPPLEPNGTVSFSGATPAIADTAAPGTAGVVQVAASESDFTVSVPVP